MHGNVPLRTVTTFRTPVGGVHRSPVGRRGQPCNSVGSSTGPGARPGAARKKPRGLQAMVPESACRLVAAFAAAVVFAGCATPDATKPAEPRPSTAPGASGTSPTTAMPATPAAPDVPPAEARPMAARLALQAVDQLQGGDDIGARATLDQALKLDPNNDLAKNLMNQINADAQRELG